MSVSQEVANLSLSSSGFAQVTQLQHAIREDHPDVFVSGHANVHVGHVFHYHAGAGKEQEASTLLQDPQDKFLEWLSTPNYWNKHDSIFSRAQPDTVQSFFEDDRVKQWFSNKQQWLWCVGEAGAGKTITSSLVIDRLLELRQDKDVILWLYIDYRDIQTLEYLMKNLLAQLFHHRGKVSDAMMRSMGTNWQKAKPLTADYRSWIRQELLQYDRATIVIDAIDETRELLAVDFLRELETQRLETPTSILVTSRNTPDLYRLRGVPQAQIQPQMSDVLLYVEKRIEIRPELRDHINSHPEIKALLKEKLGEAKNKMFLKATLILNIFENLKSVQDAQETLEKLSSDYQDYYETTLKNIERQSSSDRDLASQILAILTHAIGKMTLSALQHALLVETNTVKIEDTSIISPEELQKVCHGLVVLEKSQTADPTIGLFHETANAYLRTYKSAYTLDGHKVLLQRSLAYLSLPYFEQLCCHKSEIETRARRFPFFKYAASTWPDHAKNGSLEFEHQTQIVKYVESRQRKSADEYMGPIRRSAWGCDFATPWTDWNKLSHKRIDTPIHAVATYGLEETLRYLIVKKRYKPESRNNWNETPMHRAAQNGHTGVMELLLEHDGKLESTVDQWYLKESDALILSTICRQLEAVQLCLNHGISVNNFYSPNQFSPLHLAASMWTDMTQLLLDNGADPNFAGNSPVYPERYPMTPLHFAVFNAHAFIEAYDRVKLLLDRGAVIDARTGIGNTPLHLALLGDHLDVAILLLEKGAKFDIKNAAGKTAVQICREKGQLRSLSDDTDPKVKNFRSEIMNIPKLHLAAWSQDEYQMTQLLKDHNSIDDVDGSGSTVWTYCIASGNLELANVLIDHIERNKDTLSMCGFKAFLIALISMTKFDYTDRDTWSTSLKICQQLLPYAQLHEPTNGFVHLRSPIGNYNKTYLILAAEQQRDAQCEWLLACGADVNAADVFGDTSVHYAIGVQSMSTVKLLVKNGCRLDIADQHGRTAMDSANDGTDLDLKRFLDDTVRERSAREREGVVQ